jgi:hypothetical protein
LDKFGIIKKGSSWLKGAKESSKLWSFGVDKGAIDIATGLFGGAGDAQLNKQLILMFYTIFGNCHSDILNTPYVFFGIIYKINNILIKFGHMRLIYGSLAFLIFFTLALHNIKQRQKKSESSIVWKETIGTLDPHGYKQGTIYYDVNGKMYNGVFKGVTNPGVDSLKFTMRYNANDPNVISVDYWNPVFVEGEKTAVFIATIVRVKKNANLWKPKPFIVYKYHIGSITLKKWIFLPPNYLQLYPNLHDGQRYLGLAK